jgi:hypothetical protein
MGRSVEHELCADLVGAAQDALYHQARGLLIASKTSCGVRSTSMLVV